MYKQHLLALCVCVLSACSSQISQSSASINKTTNFKGLRSTQSTTGKSFLPTGLSLVGAYTAGPEQNDGWVVAQLVLWWQNKSNKTIKMPNSPDRTELIRIEPHLETREGKVYAPDAKSQSSTHIGLPFNTSICISQHLI